MLTQFGYPRPRVARHAVRLLLLGLLLGLLLTSFAIPGDAATGTMARATPATPAAPAPEVGPGDADPDLYAPVLPDQRDAVYAETAGRLSRYRIEATIVPAAETRPATITGTVDLRVYNDAGEDRDALYFRLYANDDRYAEGGMTLDAVAVAGVPTTPELSVADTVARVPLSAPLATGAAIDLTVGFAATVPTAAAESYGMFNYAPDSGTLALAHWFPILAGYGQDGAWNLAPPSANGDPVFANTALYDVALTAPTDLVLVTTGSEVDAAPAGDGATRHRFVSGPVRDFTVVADDDYETVTEEVDGTTVVSHFNPANAEGGAAVLRFGAQALRHFNERLGAYPYAEMDLVDLTVRNGAAGIEFPQLMFIGGDYYDDPNLARGVPTFLEDVVAHEVLHQWWYALVGNDQYVDAFIDEGLTNYLTMVYFELVYGPEVGAEQTEIYLERPYLRVLFSRGDDVVDRPTDDFASGGLYAVMVYNKAALGFGAIREAIGDEAFFGALRAYAADYRFEVAVPGDLLAAFEAAAGEELDELWRHWFEAAEGAEDYTRDDLDRDAR
ncbi:MAG: hypothetical protein AVDCRST_MAG49-2289 [uncultured Thermomicrobiales bacterium]|uniref:Peptidase M1 membrane alanine aminopeptidase domain-containing protein n=1 Tax=uncultured Thermomicrobiales bacterium TaxID=1645740 RepID=A0A6J4UW45_9BACT|nr:MAG: hypothetical protein AVDCRST_MAG49-2289 [uncultured Thermomicrobiales bacterium]